MRSETRRTRHASIAAAVVVLATSFGPAVHAMSAADGAFDAIVSHYSRIHDALVEDSLTDVSDHATAIARIADEALADPRATHLQVAADDLDTVRELLPEVVERARGLAETADLEGARRATATLTQPLVRWQRLVDGPKPVVVYCPMHRKAWLQDDGPVENPYDPTMLRCGSIVQR